MFNRMRVKQSKPSALAGMLMGIIFIVVGFTTVLPTFGMFGVLWVLICLVITATQAYNFFSNKGVSSWEVDVDAPDYAGPANNPDFETRLRKLGKLRDDGLISEEEFNRKREEIMRQPW